MNAIHRPAVSGVETARVLMSADNLASPQNLAPPSTSHVISILRRAGPKLGLSPQVLRSLELLLSCLPPKRNHHMVFASNETLVLRAQGLHERSLRRHIAALVEVGLLQRSDSPNGKRYTSHDPLTARTLRFGLDLSPLFAQLPLLEETAASAEAEARHLMHLKRKLRAAAHRLLLLDPEHVEARAAATAARRRLSSIEAQALLDDLLSTKSLAETVDSAEDLTGSDGQNVRHHLSFSKEYIEKTEAEVLQTLHQRDAEGFSYALEPLQSPEAIERHAQTLAPMLGISADLFDQACDAQGRWTVTSLIWMILEDAARIAKPAAYFRSLSLGLKAKTYRPWAWLDRRSSDCPRTTGPSVAL